MIVNIVAGHGTAGVEKACLKKLGVEMKYVN